MKYFSETNNIVRYGTKKIIFVFILLQIITLLVTSFFILRPFLQITSQTIAEQMLAINKHHSITQVNESKPHIALLNRKNYRTNHLKSQSTIELLPILYFIKSQLRLKTNSNVQFIKILEQPDFYWYHIDDLNKNIGFQKDLIGTQREMTMLLLAFFLLIVAFWFSSQISRKLNQPLLTLKNVTQRLAKGDLSAKLPAHELQEIDQAFKQVNLLTYHFKHLLEQRVIFLSGISHDIRTPITRLNLLLAINEEKLNPKFADKVKNTLREMEALVDIYLNSSQYLLNSHQKLVDISLLMASFIQSVQEQHGDVFVLNVQQGINTPVNQAVFTRVIQNLIGNSLKYAPPALLGKITINLKLIGDQVSITIVDQGKGIPEEHLEQVFKPFFRSPQENSELSGNGLGLSIARQICLTQGWLLSLSNHSEGGLVAEIKIPC